MTSRLRFLDTRTHLWTWGGLLLVGGYLVAMQLALTRSSYDIAGVFIVVPVLILMSIPLLRVARRQEADPWIRRLLGIALLAMMFMAFIHFIVDFGAYDGVADARRYSTQGAAAAAVYWEGNFFPDLGYDVIGTGFIVLFTGWVYALFGPTIIGGYLVYSWLGFWGLYFCYRAFRVAMPGADHRRYAVLVLFLPTLLLWSSGIGKGAWMTLTIGLTLFGSARLLSSAPRAVFPLLTGLIGTAMVRPHITVLLVIGLTIGVIIRRTNMPTLLSPVMRVLSIGGLGAVGILALSGVADFLGLEEFSTESVRGVLDETEENTADIGSSTFTAQRVNDPLDFPGAFLTVIFRPFPWEADNVLMLASSAEGVALMLLIVASWRRWRQVPTLLRRYPYLAMGLVAIVLFVVAFSSIGNFGLLVRERAMILPLVLVPLCLARDTRTKSSIRAAPADLDPPTEQVVLR